ncbi:MAG: hypothetical protein HYV26_16230 [Candidatus Hydrogenedentes bacterium]|nr:hypothetical protein [Candidatus Hydrogenedentota bacterium]
MSQDEHTLAATATGLGAGLASSEDTVSFNLDEAPANTDSNLNGIPDDPFDALPVDRDTWLSTIEVSPGANLMSQVTAWNNSAGGPIVAALLNPDEPGQRVTVSVPAGVLEEDEIGVLIVQWAPTLVALLGADGVLLQPEPGDGLVDGGQYVEISIIVSQDGGVTFSEIDNARLVDNPVHIAMEGLQPPSASANVHLHSHGTNVGSDPVTGIEINVVIGPWGVGSIGNETLEDDVLEADVFALSTFAPYLVSENEPVLSVTPPQLLFGIVETGKNATKKFVVRNTGGGQLIGEATVDAPFSIVSGASYDLASGETQEVSVRFAPVDNGFYFETVQFTGAGGAQRPVSGTGTDIHKPFRIFGCDAEGSGASLGTAVGNLLLTLGLFMVLLLTSRKRVAR